MVQRLQHLCAKDTKDKLLDYVENVVIYHKGAQKIIAQNHQLIGVSKGFDKFLRQGEFGGKRGVIQSKRVHEDFIFGRLPLRS